LLVSLALYGLFISIENYIGKGMGMENQVYEFNSMNLYKKKITVEFLDNEIGKEYEVENNSDGTYIITVYDLNMQEVEIIRAFECENL